MGEEFVITPFQLFLPARSLGGLISTMIKIN